MNPFKGRHFQRDIILWTVRWYCKYGISYRELQELQAFDLQLWQKKREWVQSGEEQQ